MALLGTAGRGHDLELVALGADAATWWSKTPKGEAGAFTWAWGASAPTPLALPAPDPSGARLFAWRDDGVSVTWGRGRGDRPAFVVARGTEVRHRILQPENANRVMLIHDRLVVFGESSGGAAELLAFDLDAGKRLWKVAVVGDDVWKASVLAAPQRSVVVALGAELTFYDVDSGLVQRRVPCKALDRIALSPDGSLVAGSCEEGLALLDLARCERTFTVRDRAVCDRPAFVAGGRLLATTWTDQTLRLFSVPDGRLAETIDLKGVGDELGAITDWNARQAMVVHGRLGQAYVFAVTAEARAEASAPTPEPKPEPAPAALSTTTARATAKWPAPTSAWAFSRARQAAGDDPAEAILGGVPDGFDDATWPTCRGCHQPMSAVLTLRAHPERLPLVHHASLVLFVCGAPTPSCSVWEPTGGANAAVLVDLERVRSQPALLTAPTGAAGATPVIRRSALVLEKLRDSAARAEHLLNKLGGRPDGLAADRVPRCASCGAPMRLAAQLSEQLDKVLNFGDGVGFLFVCPSEHEARFLA